MEQFAPLYALSVARGGLRGAFGGPSAAREVDFFRPRPDAQRVVVADRGCREAVAVARLFTSFPKPGVGPVHNAVDFGMELAEARLIYVVVSPEALTGCPEILTALACPPPPLPLRAPSNE